MRCDAIRGIYLFSMTDRRYEYGGFESIPRFVFRSMKLFESRAHSDAQMILRGCGKYSSTFEKSEQQHRAVLYEKRNCVLSCRW